MDEFVVTECIWGTWHYHISKIDNFTSLCGVRVMRTSIPMSRWGLTPENYHIPESWCKKCKTLFDQEGD